MRAQAIHSVQPFREIETVSVPKGWRVGMLQDCCNKIQNGGTPKRNVQSYWNNPTIPWLTSGEVRQSIVIETESFISDDGSNTRFVCYHAMKFRLILCNSS